MVREGRGRDRKSRETPTVKERSCKYNDRNKKQRETYGRGRRRDHTAA